MRISYKKLSLLGVLACVPLLFSCTPPEQDMMDSAMVSDREMMLMDDDQSMKMMANESADQSKAMMMKDNYKKDGMKYKKGGYRQYASKSDSSMWLWIGGGVAILAVFGLVLILRRKKS